MIWWRRFCNIHFPMHSHRPHICSLVSCSRNCAKTWPRPSPLQVLQKRRDTEIRRTAKPNNFLCFPWCNDVYQKKRYKRTAKFPTCESPHGQAAFGLATNFGCSPLCTMVYHPPCLLHQAWFFQSHSVPQCSYWTQGPQCNKSGKRLCVRHRISESVSSVQSVRQAASLARISLTRPSLLAGVNKPLSQIRSALWP